MILSVILNPCIDVNIEVDSLSVGMSHKIISRRTFYTGKSVNVATGIARLGAQSFATGFMFEDNGRLFEQELHSEGVSYKLVWNKGRVSENYKFVDEKSMLTEFVTFSPEISQEKQDELLSLILQISPQSEAVVVSGGLAEGIAADYYAKILRLIPQGVKKVVDTEGEGLLQALSVGVDLVKPNLEELQRTLNVRIKSCEGAKNACKKLVSMGAKIVLLSLGKQGAIISDGERCYFCHSINVAMNSTVGAGDAMVAAATLALARGEDLSEILRCGVAAGTAAVTLPDSISFRKEKYEEILSTLEVKEI
ncbi:MAG: 1-phosphofructokinase family hexose kinase [Candidatus Coproplasma sp.]